LLTAALVEAAQSDPDLNSVPQLCVFNSVLRPTLRITPPRRSSRMMMMTTGWAAPRGND
jgi:hypothetical protein